MWPFRRNPRLVISRSSREEGSALDPFAQEVKPRPKYRIVEGPHDRMIRVQEDISYEYPSSPPIWALIHAPFVSLSEAETWLEEHLAGPKVLKEIPRDA
jgi:hypothetical protein